MYKMDEKYLIGVELIDQQHEKLFALTNEVYELLKDNFKPDKYDNIVSVLNELREYSKIHFRDEEEYMEQIGYKKLFTQKMDHAEFMQKFNEVNLDEIDENQDEYISGLLNFLSNWLIEHILEKDKLIANS